jgi:hypothetical protein
MSEPERERGRVWGLVIAAIVAVVGALIALPDVIRTTAPDLRAGDYAGPAGAVAGSAFVIALIIWGVLYLTFIRSRAPERGLAYFLILFAVAAVTQGGIIAAAKSVAVRQQANQAASNDQMRTALGEMKKAVATVMNPNGGAVDMHVHATGEAGELERATKTMMVSVSNANRDYRAEIAALGFPAIVQPAQLATAAGVARARVKLREGRAVVTKYRALNETLIVNARAAIAGAAMSDATKKSALEGFDGSVARDKARREHLWDDEDAIFAEFALAMDGLAHARGPWKTVGREIMFSNARDLESYRAHMANVRRLSQEENAITAAARNDVLQELPPQPAN